VELSDAVEKAADQVNMPMFSMGMTPAGPRFMDTEFLGNHNYEYLQELKPLVSKWGDIIGKAIADKAYDMGEFAEGVDHDADDRDVSDITDAFDQIHATKGVDIACGVFALGYMLGSPELDKQPHDRKTFHSALADRDIHTALTRRFSHEDFLRNRFREIIEVGAVAISTAFGSMNLPHNKANVHEWGKLSVVVCFYEAFQIGLKSRRIWEEDMAFDQIARGLED
jgi:hypothetical protein